MASVCANFLVLISLMSFAASSRSAKIVGLPMMGGSQYMGMKNIGLELAKRGHQVRFYQFKKFSCDRVMQSRYRFKLLCVIIDFSLEL